MKFTIRQLQIFLAVVNHDSTLAASQALGMSQPAVSSALAGLEEQLGARLFDRWKQRMFLNDQGRKLLPMARTLIAKAMEVEQQFSGDGQLISGVLRLGASRTLASYVIPESLASFATLHPALNIDVLSRNKTGIIAGIEDFSLDIGIIAGTSNRIDVVNRPWITDELCVFCANDHPLAAKESISLADLAASKWVLREEGSGTLEVFLIPFGRPVPDTLPIPRHPPAGRQ